RRVYVYNTVAEIRYGQPVASFALLIDDRSDWRPAEYSSELYGTRRSLSFRAIKLLDYGRDKAALEADANPVALLVLAWLEEREAGGDYEKVLASKLRISRMLHARGMPADEVGHWLAYLDWLLWLPREYNLRLVDALDPAGQEQRMPLTSFIEEYFTDRGR